jgi:ketosteroid isomerase-like protein
MSEEDNKELVRRFFATLSSGDLEAVKGFFGESSTWGIGFAEDPSVRRGPTEIIDDFLVPIREGLFEPENPKVEIQNLWADGDWVIAETVGTGPMLNGNAYRNVYAFVLRVEGGVIAEMREYMDTAYAAKVTAGPVG